VRVTSKNELLNRYDKAARGTAVKALSLHCGGIEYCVDHIIPIAHPDVCGLHTFANLQIITSEENRKKGQHFDPTEHEFIAEKS
jgi:5-methylcytosine-specific restriction endonuclease McrA